MKNKILILAFLLSAGFALSGCSYKDFDDKVQDALQGQPQSMGGIDGYTSDGRPYVEAQMLSENQIDFIGIGEAVSAYKSFTLSDSSSETLIEKGVEGLTYTVEKVKSFPSISDADVDSHCILDNQNAPETNAFVLVDIKAAYTAPSDSLKEVMADANDLSGMLLTSKLSDPVEETQKPCVGYFSLRPQKDDPRLDYRHQALCYYIKDGETIHFQLGIFCEQKHIDNKNVFLEVNEVPQPNEDVSITGDFARKLFVLFPENEG